jgi:hypothetical protein
VKSLNLSDSKFEQVGHGFNYDDQHLLLIVSSASIIFVNHNIGIDLAVLFKMSGRGRRNNGRGGRGRGGAGCGGCGRGQGKGQHYNGSANAAKRGVCTNLGTNVFDYGQKSSADQICTSWEKLVQYVGTNYGQDINNKLQNNITDFLIEPVHTNDVLTRHSVSEVMIRTGQLNIHLVLQAEDTIIKASVLAVIDIYAKMKLAIIQNMISQGEFAANIEVPVEFTDSDKTQFSNDWRTLQESNANLVRPSFLANPGPMYPFAPIQNEAVYRLEYSDHII